MKKTQLNIEIDEGMLKSLKLLAISRDLKLNTLVKQILNEKINSKTFDEIDNYKMIEYSNEISKLKERLTKIENSQKIINS